MDMSNTERKITLKSWFEYDTLTGWHRVLCYTQRPGVRVKGKRSYHKRFRRVEKQQIQGELAEWSRQ